MIYRSPPLPSMHRLGLLLLLCVLCTTRGEMSTFIDVNPCDGKINFDAGIDNDVLYNQVYNWMHQKKISNWTYNKVEATASMHTHFPLPDNATLSCAEVSYEADLQLPGIFETFLYHLGVDLNLPIIVHKTVCLTGESIIEHAEVDEVVLERVYIDAVHQISDSALRTSTQVRMDLPWYARMLSRLVTQHIGESVAEKNRAVLDSLCTPRKPPALHESNSSFLTAPKYTHMRRKSIAGLVVDRLPRTWKLRREQANTSRIA